MRVDLVLLTCEHATARIPAAYRVAFTTAGRELASHRGHDAGALAVARALSRRLGAPLLIGTVSRLLIDLNRSETNPAVFSSFSQQLDVAQQKRLIERYHRPHLDRVRASIARLTRDGATLLHIGVHSFTPILRGVRRNAEVGLLYDPARTGERELALGWSRELRALQPELRVRRNYPYRGAADGLTTQLRREFAGRVYLGFELELNASLITPQRRAGRTRPPRMSPSRVAQLVHASLAGALGDRER